MARQDARHRKRLVTLSYNNPQPQKVAEVPWEVESSNPKAEPLMMLIQNKQVVFEVHGGFLSIVRWALTQALGRQTLVVT